MFTYFVLILTTACAYWIGQQFPVLGSSTSAILLGAILAQTPLKSHLNTSLIKKISSSLLKYAIIFLGLTLSFKTLSGIGFSALFVIVPVIFVAFATATLLGKKLRIPRNTQLLVGMGTAICGGSAIAAAAPILEADEDDIAFAITTIFLFNLVGLLIFPMLGRLLGYSDVQFGIFAGAAINDTSSVVAAGFAYSDAAGEIATVVKLVRTLMIVPACLTLLYTRYRHSEKNAAFSLRQLQKIIPTFIIGFVLAVVVASVFSLPADWVTYIKLLSRLMMTAALSAVGLSMNIQQLKHAGRSAIVLGGLTWGAVILATILFIHLGFPTA
ncbi:MAG: putative sulfate exporter family transporter [Aerococcaceae bacterium]|nr:putative sulfate exporter family transporter [Aerococcaceae bacterium]